MRGNLTPSISLRLSLAWYFSYVVSLDSIVYPAQVLRKGPQAGAVAVEPESFPQGSKLSAVGAFLVPPRWVSATAMASWKIAQKTPQAPSHKSGRHAPFK